VSPFTWSLAHLKPYKARVVTVSVLSLAEIGLAALAPWPLKLVVDSVLGSHPLPAMLGRLATPFAASSAALLIAIVIAGMLLQIATELARVAHTQLQVEMGQRVVYDLRAQLLKHLQALPLRHHIAARTADSVYRIDADAYCVNDLIIGGAFPLAIAALNLMVMFAILLRVDLTLALLSLAVAPFLFVSLRYYSGRMTDRAERVKERESSLVERAYEILSSIAAIKSFTREGRELERFVGTGEETMQARLHLTWQESLFSVCVTVITLAGTALVLAVGGLHVLDGTLTIGSLLVVTAYLAAVYQPLSSIAHTTGSLQQAYVSVRRVREILALAPEPADTAGSLDAASISGEVVFDHVGFAYDDARPILMDVSFTARPGETVALVGLTGAGKTTIVNLIPRFFEPTSGRVLIDGVAASRYSLRSLRNQIALVPQDVVLFSGTIGDNIRFGRPDATHDEMTEVARATLVAPFVERLPHGYDTPVDEAGASLSGGERQRLGLARALLKRAPILILDEPTSALDSISEEAVFDALRTLREGRTTIVIAHRLSTIRDASRILVLHEGKLVAQGTHNELMASSELYRRMCARLSVGHSLDEPESVDDVIKALV
jgi:ATP-binding cassette subfamily B protein